MLFSNSKSQSNRFTDQRFPEKVINSLPGIFYVYEKIDDQYFLKRWNDNHITKLKFENEDLLDMQPHQFFSKEEYRKIDIAIRQIFTEGNTQVKAKITTKNNLQIPYFFEGYKYEDEGKKYFIGVGLDISTQHLLEKNLSNAEYQKEMYRLEKQRITDILNTKKRELITISLQTSKTERLIEKIEEQLDNLIKKHPDTEICMDLKNIQKSLNRDMQKQDNWELFKLRFKELHEDFFDKLKEKHSGLSNSELKFCSYLRIRMSTPQIASALNVTNEAIRKSRYRIRKNLGLNPEESLEDYISLF